MGTLENKNIQPVVAAAANFCCLNLVGYLLLGQATKGIFVLVTGLVMGLAMGLLTAAGFALFILPGILLLILSVLLGLGYGILGALDAYKVAEAIQQGEEVDENEYRVELLYRILSIAHKDAVFQGGDTNRDAAVGVEAQDNDSAKAPSEEDHRSE